MCRANGYVVMIITMLNEVTIKMACAGKFFIWSNLLAPRYWDTIADIALRVCPKTQMSIDINAVTIPTAANDSVGFKFTLPTIAASDKDKTGSEIPEIKAGIANLLMFLKLILLFINYCGLISWLHNLFL